jgi:Protein of unknown function (DUF3592)
LDTDRRGVCLLIFDRQVFNLFRMRSQMRAAESWNAVDGVITVSRVDQPPSHISDDQNDASPVIHHRYRAGGQDFESDQIKIGGQPLTTRVLAGRQVARYPVGTRVAVYVDPGNPGNVLLEPGRQDNLAALLAFTIVFGCLAVILTAHALAGKVLYTGNGVPMFAFVVPILAILAAILSLVSFVRGMRLASASARWPTAAGTVTTSDVIEEEIEDTSSSDKSIFERSIATKSICATPIRSANATLSARSKIGAGREFTVFANSRPAATGRVSPSPSITTRRSRAMPCSNRTQRLAGPVDFWRHLAVMGGVILVFFVRVGFGN